MKSFSKLSLVGRECRAWSELDGESFFITGGTGFFGAALLYSLLEAKLRFHLNINVSVLTRNVCSFKLRHPVLAESSFITFLEGDVTNFNFPDQKFTKIFHLATTSASETFKGEDQLSKYKTLVDGTERVLQFAVKCNADKILFTSSGVVYGVLPTGMQTVKEVYSGAPDTCSTSSALAQGKRSAEFLISFYAEKYGFDYVIARCFSFIGPNLPLDLHYAVGNFMNDALYGDCIEIKGDGKPVRSYLDVNDLTVWLLRLMSTKCNHSIYNVGSDQSVSIFNLADEIRNLISPDKEIKVRGDDAHVVGNFSRNFYVPNIDRVKNELGVDVWIGLSQAIERLKIGVQKY